MDGKSLSLSKEISERHLERTFPMMKSRPGIMFRGPCSRRLQLAVGSNPNALGFRFLTLAPQLVVKEPREVAVSAELCCDL